MGGIAGLAIIGAAIFFYLRSKRRSKAAAGNPTSQLMSDYGPTQDMGQGERAFENYGDERFETDGVQMVGGRDALHEMGASTKERRDLHEMSTT